MNLYVEVDGYSRPAQSLTVEWSLKQRSTAEVTLLDIGALYAIGMGQGVIIADSDLVHFAGTIDELTPIWNPGTPDRRWHIRCISNEHTATRRMVSGTFTRDPADLIILNLATLFWDGEGIDASTLVTSGPDVGPFTWDHATFEQALDDIGAEANKYWDITHDKKLRFFDRSAFAAPWNITESSPEVRKRPLKLTTDRQKVANKVHVKVGQYIGDAIAHNFETVELLGANSFGVAYPIGEKPSISIDGAVKTVGALGLDVGKQWYWTVGSNVLTQADSEPAIVDAAASFISYRPLSSATVTVEDTANQAERAAIELTSGIYEVVIEAATPTTRQDAQRLGEAYLAAHKDDSVVMAFDTLQNDLQVGMIMNVILPFLGLGGPSGTNMLIETIRLTADPSMKANFNVSCSTGALLESWQQAFSGGGGQSISIGAGLQSTISGAVREQEVILAANTTIDAAIAATAGAQLMLVVKQNDTTPYTATLGTGFATAGQDLGITATLDKSHAFAFFGRADGLWWPTGVPAMEII